MDPLLQSRGKKPRRGTVLACPHCGGSFYVALSDAGRRKYCSHVCKTAAQVRQVAVTCERCGKEFERAQSRGGRFCSWGCYHQARPARTDCELCGGVLPNRRRRFCSSGCAARARLRGREMPCEQCGSSMYVEPAQDGKKRYCSRDCANKALEIEGPGCVIRRKDGYLSVYYPKHPDATRDGWVLQHRLVAEEKYGRRVLWTEHVHHINGQRDDNRPENLEVISPSDHARDSVQRGKQKRKTLREELEEYRRRFGPLE